MTGELAPGAAHDAATHPRRRLAAPLSRRDFLKSSGRVAAAAGLATQLGWLTACSSGSGPNWDALARSLRGRLIRPGQPGYMATALPENTLYATNLPAGIARCADTTDVATAIRWARENGVTLVAAEWGPQLRGLLDDLRPDDRSERHDQRHRGSGSGNSSRGRRGPQP